MSKKAFRDIRRTPYIFIVLLLLVFFSLIDSWIFYSDQLFHTLPSKLIAHLALSIVLIFTIFSCAQRKIDQRFLILFGLFTVSLGPPGALTILAALVLYLLYIRFTEPLGDLLATLLPPNTQDAGDILYERIIYKLDDFHPDRIPLPFKDIMTFGTYKQKRMTIEKILRYYRPEFAPALKAGLEDKSSAVKVQAATALSYIDHKLFEENVELKKLCEEDPDDLEALLTYAQHTKNYVYAEILDPDRKQKMVRYGIQAYRQYLNKKPGDLESKLSLAELVYASGDYPGAELLLDEILAIEFSSSAALLQMKVLFQMKDYEKLQVFAKDIKRKIGPNPLHDELHSAVLFWSGNLTIEP